MPRPDPGFPIKPSPPKYPPKTPPTDTTVPQYARAVIAMVDDVNKPTVATVYVDNSLPAEDGYKIPTSLGMKFVEAPSAWSSTTAYNPGDLTELNGAAYQCLTANTNSQPPNANWTTPTGIAFYNNTVTMKGGSWCDVDTYNKVISRIEQGESNGPPSNPSDLFQFIQHNGAYNTTGNFVNPGPIDTTQLLIGSLNVTPNITGVGTVSKSSSGAGTTDFMITGFTVDSVGTTASKWLNAIYCVSSVHNANNWSLCGHISPGSTGNYGGVWGGIGSGILPYDLGIVYVDLSGNVSNVGTLWANQQPNTLNSGLASLPGGPPPFTVTSANVVYTAINSTSYSISIPFTITSNVPGAAAGIAAWMTLHGQNAIAYNIGILPIGNNTITTPAIPDSTQTYDVYLAWVDAAGNKGQSLIVYTTSAYTAAAPGSGGTMPSNTSALTSLSGVQVVTYSGSGSGSGSTLGKALSFGGGSNASGTGVIEWTITEDSTQNAQLWNNGLRLVYANPLVAYLQAPVSSGATSVTIPWYGNSNDPSVGNTVLLFAGWPTGNKGYYLSQTPSDIVTISSVGTPSQLNGITVNTITFGTALTGSYSGVESFLCTVPRQTDWVEAGRLPWNNTSTYTGVWDCLPGSLFAAQVVDFSNNNSTVTNSDISVIMFNPVKRMKITQGPSLALTVPNVVSNAGFTYANSGNGAYDAIDTVTLDAVATVGGPVSAVEMLVSSAYFSDTIAAVSSGGAVLTLTAADAKVKIGQQVAIDTGSLTEYNIVTDVSGTSVTLAFNLSNSHGANTSVTFSSWTHYGYIPVVQANSSNQGVYSCEWVSLGAGTAYTLGLRYVDHNNNTSYAASIGTTVANPLTNTALPTMPAGAAISVSGVTEVIYESGMHTILTNVTGFAPMVEVSFTLGDTNNPLATTWGDHFVGYIRQNGTTSWASVPQVSVPASSLTNGSTQNVKFHVTPGYNYDFGVLLADKNGNLTNSGTPVSLGTNYSIPKVQKGDPVGPIWGIGHFLGDTSGDTTTTIVDGGNRRFLHPVMSAGVQGVIDNAGTLDVSTARSGKILPYGNHATPFQNRIGGDGTLNVAENGSGGPGPVAGELPHANHSPAVQNVIDSAGTLDVSTARSGKVLPYGNHAAPITNRIGGDGTLNVAANGSGGPGPVSGNLPHVNHSIAVQNAIDSSSNLLTTRFPSQTKLINSGTYAGWELCTFGTQTPAGGNFNGIMDESQGLNCPNVGDWVWAEWTVWNPGTSINNSPAGPCAGWGPGFVDANGHWVIINHYFQGGNGGHAWGSGYVNDGGLLAAHTANDPNKAHTFRIGWQSVAGGQFRVVCYANGVKTWDRTLNLAWAAPLHPSFGYDVANYLYIKDFQVQSATVAHEQHSPGVQSVIGSIGSISIAPPGGVSGQLGGTNISSGTIQQTHIANQAVNGPLVQSTEYSTQQTNTAGSGSNATDWYSPGFGNYITSSNYTIPNGGTIKWDTGSGSYAGSSNPYSEALTIAGKGTSDTAITCIFKHAAFLSGAVGKPRVFFTGQTSGSTSYQAQSTAFSGSSTCNVSGTAQWDAKDAIYINWSYSQANGSPYTISVSPNTAVNATQNLTLALNSVNCPSSTDGTSSLTVQLKDSGGTVLQTWAGITTSQTLTYSTAHTTDTFTWSIWAVPVNNDGTASPYNENMQDTFSGTAGYYNSVGSSGGTYVKSADGAQRLTTSDANILFTMISADTIAFQVFNSSTSSTGFSIGVDVSGL